MQGSKTKQKPNALWKSKSIKSSPHQEKLKTLTVKNIMCKMHCKSSCKGSCNAVLVKPGRNYFIFSYIIIFSFEIFSYFKAHPDSLSIPSHPMSSPPHQHHGASPAQIIQPCRPNLLNTCSTC